MTRRTAGGLAGVLLALAAAGCGAEDSGEAENATAVVATGDSVAAATLEDTAAPVATQPAVLTVGTSSEHGTYIADAGARALYMLEEDPEGESRCYDECARMWPPLIDPVGTPRAGAEPVRPELIGTTRRRDGRIQVTYGGHPLYLYARDEVPGQTTGHGVHDEWGGWYLVAPSGEHIESH